MSKSWPEDWDANMPNLKQKGKESCLVLWSTLQHSYFFTGCLGTEQLMPDWRLKQRRASKRLSPSPTLFFLFPFLFACFTSNVMCSLPTTRCYSVPGQGAYILLAGRLLDSSKNILDALWAAYTPPPFYPTSVRFLRFQSSLYSYCYQAATRSKETRLPLPRRRPQCSASIGLLQVPGGVAREGIMQLNGLNGLNDARRETGLAFTREKWRGVQLEASGQRRCW